MYLDPSSVKADAPGAGKLTSARLPIGMLMSIGWHDESPKITLMSGFVTHKGIPTRGFPHLDLVFMGLPRIFIQQRMSHKPWRLYPTRGMPSALQFYAPLPFSFIQQGDAA